MPGTCTRRALLAAVGGGLAGCGGFRESAPDATAGLPTETTPASLDPRDPPTVRIEGGTYPIGSDDGPDAVRPRHAVDLDAFRIDRYEVTVAAFAAFLNDLDVTPRGSAAPGEVSAANFPPGEARRFIEGPEGAEERPLVALDDEHARIGVAGGRFVVGRLPAHPVNEVTWDGARAFAEWRGARLPTEVEWEAAARGREGRTYPWGEGEPTPERAVYGRASGETAPVGSHPKGATPAGVHDMAGNVSEWTSTLFRPYPYRRDGREDPTVRGERVTRGGAHVFFSPGELTTYQRSGFSREFDRGHRHIGFRCVASG